MKKRKIPYSYFLLLLFPLSILLTYLAVKYPSIVESFYSRGLYLKISQLLSISSKVFTISLGEVILFVFLFLFIASTIRYSYNTLRKSPSKRGALIKGVLNILVLISVLYFLFITSWGLNYHRLPFSTIANLDVQPSSIEDLEILSTDLIARSNTLREKIIQDKDGVTDIPNGFQDVAQRAQIGFDIVAKQYPELAMQASKPKGILFSQAMSYAGIAGIYSPFTAEANVNTILPYSMLPNTTAHEMAHQRGFAREDESNYIAYLACTAHPDVDFQYSGVLLALIHSMNALYKYDPLRHALLVEEYSDGLLRDLAAISSFWNSYRGPIERTSSKFNNAYLKSNLQEDGIKSYGRMVDLLIAEYRRDHLIPNNI